jgi:phosphoribosyl 1,2-cyclic phosphodiesterase
MTRFASLGSGSEGNCLIFEAGATRVLVDCGFKPKEAQTRLERLGIEPASLSGIVVTHEHSDHAGGVFALARLHSLGVWLTHGTLAAMREPDPDAGRDVACHIIDGQSPFAIGDARVEPFTVPHDAREPVQFVLSDGARRLGVLTDAGCSTPRIQESLSGCDALVLEANHDLDMLWNGIYPPWLKKRVASRFGHLNNGASASLLAALDRSRLRHVIAAHLSKRNNTVELARTALVAALNCEPGWLGIADQAEGFAWRDL